jgi:hypothetical protein
MLSSGLRRCTIRQLSPSPYERREVSRCTIHSQ